MPINSLPVRQEVTAEVLRILYNDCCFLRWFGREHEKYFEERVPIGTTLQIKRPWKPVGRQGQAFQPEPVVQTTVPLTISYWRGCDFIYNDTDENLYFDMENFHENYSKPIGILIANQIDADFASFAQVTTPNFVGTPGTTPTGTSTYNNAQTLLNKQLAPQMDRSVIYTSDFNQNLVGASQTLFNPAREVSDQYMDGYVGKYAGFKFAIDEQIPGFTSGTWAGSGWVAGAGQSGSTLATANWTSASLSLVPGDRFTIAGVYKVNPQGLRTAYSSSYPMQFVVTQAVTDSTGSATLNIYPPLIPSGQFQNCSASPANHAAITIVTTSGQSCSTAFAFQKDAYTSAFLKLHEPENTLCTVVDGDMAGIKGVYIRSVKQWQSSGPYAGYETERFDVIYGVAAQYADYFSTVIYGG